MNKKSTRQVTEIYFSNEHFLANLLALTKILGIPLNIAKLLCRNKAGEWIKVENTFINSKDSTDTVFADLDEYEIKIKLLINN